MVKLFKIASEINIGKDAIVEFLQGKGFDIHNKPTTNLTDDMVNIVMDKFKREKKAADIQREKLQKHKDVKQDVKKVEPIKVEEKPVVNSRKLDFSVFDEVEKPVKIEKFEKSDKTDAQATKKEQDIALASIINKENQKVRDIPEQSEKVSDIVKKPYNEPKPPQPIVVPVQEVKPVYEKIQSIREQVAAVSETPKAKPEASKFETPKFETPKFESPKPLAHKPEPKDIIEDEHLDDDSQSKFFPPGHDNYTGPKVGSVINLKPYKSDDSKGYSKTDYKDRSKQPRQGGERPKFSRDYQKDKPVDFNKKQPDDSRRFENRTERSSDNRRSDRRNENRPPDTRFTDKRNDKPTESRPTDNRFNENRPNENRPNENRPNDRQPDNRPTDNRFNNDRRGDFRQGDNRPRFDNRRDDQNRPADGKRPDFNRDNNRSDAPRFDNNRPDNRNNFQNRRQDSPRPASEFRDNRPDNRPDNRRNSDDPNRFQGQAPQQFDNQRFKPQDRQPDSFQSADADAKRKKKRKSIIEVAPNDSVQLKGLTVLGRIDITPEEREARAASGRFGSFDDFKSRFDKKKKKPDDKVGKVDDKKTTTVVKAKEHEKDDKKKKKRKKSIRESISQIDVDRAIRETLAGMDVAAAGSLRSKYKKNKKVEREEKEQRIQEEKDRDSKIIRLAEFVTTADIGNLMGVSPSEVILKCMGLGLMVTINQRLDKETITIIADDYGFSVEFMDEKQVQFEEVEEEPEGSLQPRAPIVTIMGHVDHGKTSLLDFIRSANVVAGEAGGITQHIGAYSVELPDGRAITFLDTPGHEAFTAMRARGAQITDIVVLVVAADDSVMPQTIEAISHAKAANVPIIVAINKIDKADANPDRIKQQLADQGILVEDWGGKYQSVHISAKKGINVDQLLDKILLEAEILELSANPDRNGRGLVIESRMNKGYGSTATIIVQKGSLTIGDPFVAGVQAGKVRALINERGVKVDSVGPSDPIMVIGFDGLPEAGDSFLVTPTDAEARRIANERQQMKREQELRQIRHITLDEISAQIQMGGVKDLFLVIKGDVAGSVEALSDSLFKLSRDEVRVQILHKGVGTITENDVMLAAASNAVVIGFNVNPSGSAKRVAETERVDIRIYNIIYDCINEIQLALEGLLTPEYKEEITSSIEIRKVFKISKTGNIAGCYVVSGKINRNDKIRVMRDGFKVFEGELSTLKRNKDDVREVDSGYECGIALHNFNDVQEGDIIEGFKINEIKRKFK